MELEQAIKDRRSIRKYLQTPVSGEQIDSLIEAARLCQSGKNRQPWAFLVLQDAQKDHVADLMEQQYQNGKDRLPPHAATSVFTAGVIRQAPVLILVFREPDEVFEVGDLLSIGAAVEHICLRAVDLGLGALWVRDVRYAEDAIKEYAGQPQLELVCAVTVGYAAQSPAPRPRKSAQEILLPVPKK